MKNFYYHFKTTLVFGLVILSIISYSSVGLARSFLARTDSQTDSQAADSSTPVSYDVKTSADYLEVSKTSSEIPAETWQPDSQLILWAINPGYTVDGTRDVGEFIELRRTTDTSVLLAGYSLRYTNASGTSTTLIEFSEGSSMAGESLLLRLARSSTSAQSDAIYMTTLAMSAGKLEIIYYGVVVDSVCWSGKDDCNSAFKSSTPTVLLRSSEFGDFSHVTEYNPPFDSEKPSLILPEIINDSSESAETLSSSSCSSLEFSEILTYYAGDKTEQFIEFYNPTDENINLASCKLRYKKKDYQLSGTISPDGYHAYYPNQNDVSFSLTKNPNSSNTIELLNSSSKIVDSLVYNHGQKKSTSYARFYDPNGEEIWRLTYTPTPGGANSLQEFRSCPEGKVINIATGNCVNASSLKVAETDCPAGKYRNPLTGRCKKISTDADGNKPCAEGYERNPETNRCRKIKKDNQGAEHALVPETYSDQKIFVAFGVVGLIVVAGASYIIFQFRQDLLRWQRKLRQRLHHVCKNLVARGRSLHRNKKT